MSDITVDFKKIKKIVQILKDSGTNNSDQVSFEFIVGSLFPEVYDNIKQKLMQAHAQGYAEGLRDSKKGQS